MGKCKLLYCLHSGWEINPCGNNISGNNTKEIFENTRWKVKRSGCLFKMEDKGHLSVCPSVLTKDTAEPLSHPPST